MKRDPRRGGPARFRVLALHKPYGYLSRFGSEPGRPGLAGLVPVPGVYAAGRLDLDSEGLLLLTDDGALAHGLTDPRCAHPRTYWVQVERVPDARALAALARGVRVQGRRTRPARVRRLREAPPLVPRPVPVRFRKSVSTAWLELTLCEGRNRQVRRMTAAVGHPTLRLVRAAIGPLRLGDLGLAPGGWRELRPGEKRALRASLSAAQRSAASAPSRAARSAATPRSKRPGSRRRLTTK